ncbi:MAG: nitronate monooxygenase, partial [Solirubrobacteraceae bacterium]|nr:nitronate monooxygenase [Solirubrobacteraceae bacterium]
YARDLGTYWSGDRGVIVFEHPIVQAPMGGGASTPALAAAVSNAGGLGSLAAGYKTPEAVREEIAAVRSLTARPYAVNIFTPPGDSDPQEVERYAARLAADAARLGIVLGRPKHDDDGWEAKLALVAEERVPIVSFAFGCPTREVLDELRAAGSETWVTVTTPAEAREATRAGADALVVQGVEAGAHRGSFDDHASGDVGLLALLQLVRAQVDLPLVAAGGIATGAGVAAVLAAGAEAAALGTAFLRTTEAGTAAVHRAAIGTEEPTALTRAFTGRTARGIANRFLLDHSAEAPSAYPDVHYITAPLRAAARERSDPDLLHLWAGQAHALTRDAAAGALVEELAAGARRALRDAAERFGG